MIKFELKRVNRHSSLLFYFSLLISFFFPFVFCSIFCSTCITYIICFIINTYFLNIIPSLFAALWFCFLHNPSLYTNLCDFKICNKRCKSASENRSRWLWHITNSTDFILRLDVFFYLLLMQSRLCYCICSKFSNLLTGQPCYTDLWWLSTQYLQLTVCSTLSSSLLSYVVLVYLDATCWHIVTLALFTCMPHYSLLSVFHLCVYAYSFCTSMCMLNDNTHVHRQRYISV